MPAAEPSTPVPQTAVDYPRIGLLSVAHFMNDLYGNAMTSLTPYLVLRHRISFTMAGFVLLVYLIGSSVLQPAFGLLSDRTGRRVFVVLGPLWIGIAASAFGLVQGEGWLLLLAAVGGIGTAAFHPQSAAIVNTLSRVNKGWAMSIFSLGGNIGFAFGPVIAALLAGVGLQWSVVLFVPGIGLTVLLALYTPHPSVAGGTPAIPLRHIGAGKKLPLSLIVCVIALRSGVQYALIISLPLYFHARGYAPELGSYYAFVLSIAGALGGLLGGHLSDLYGRRRIVVGSLLLAAPFLAVSLLVPAVLVWPCIAVGGAALLASNSVTVVQGQELLPGNTGIAAGLTLGLGFGLSGVITSTITSFSDHVGVQTAIFGVPLLTLMAAGAAAFIAPGRSAGLKERAVHFGQPTYPP